MSRGGPSPHAARDDAFRAAALALLAVVIGLSFGDGRDPDALGWPLLLGGHVPLAWRRRRPLLSFLGMVAFLGPYHALDYNHTAATAPVMVSLYTIATMFPPRRALLIGGGLIGVIMTVSAVVPPRQVTDVLPIAGWIVAFLLLGGYVRVHRQYVASVVERAERAERTREEEARRRVAEERLRIARDLHDLLAHSITLIGVQTSVAAHVLAADPDRLDRAAVAQALDDIAETCRTARGELRGTLEVLREPEHGVLRGGEPAGAHGGDGRGPLPGLDGVPDLVAAARTAGAEVEVETGDGIRGEGVPSAVGAAAYRIVQEALTNAVRHAGPDVTVRVTLRAESGALHVTVTDDGYGAGVGVGHLMEDVPWPDGGGGSAGFGLVGMRERARSVGGTLEAGTRPAGGFGVTAVLPLGSGPTTGAERWPRQGPVVRVPAGAGQEAARGQGPEAGEVR
ncbi:sensor histidine kinase [Streptomyces sp. NPDC058371]|uniref:sensor histidine kinase n=1 Tax=Streptomyces sp. NPDC058371 TaxID=3346463 RepID=UPI0036692DAB